MTAQLSPPPLFRATDGLGFPLFKGQLTTYQAGTLIPQATYVDSTQTTPNTNPIILNARGECSLWLDPNLTYKFALTDQFGNNIPGWPVDNIPGGPFTPGILVSLIPNPTNALTLGNPTHTWANLYLGPNGAPALGASGNIGYYTRTPTEIALGVIPTDFSYPADPYVDPRRYGADPLGVSLSTTAVQTAINVAIRAAGMVWIGNACTYLVGALVATISSGAQSIRIMGSSTKGSILQATSGLSATSLLTLKASVLGTPQEMFSSLENFTIQGPVGGIISGVHGLSLLSAAKFRLSGMRIAGFDRGVDGQGILTCEMDQGSEFALNNIGISIIFAGLGVTNNLIRVSDCQINLNAQQGVNYNGGTGLYLSQCDIEANGTTGNLTTGGVFVGGQCSPDALEGHVVIERCWFEGNKGWTTNVAAQTNGCALRSTIKSCEYLSNEAGRAILISGSTFAHLEDMQAGGAGTGIQTFSAFTGGSGYVNANYTNVPLTGGSGSGAQASISVVAGAVSNITITVPGTGYTIGNVLSASNANLGGSGSGFTLTIGTLSADTFNITAGSATLIDIFPAVLIDSGITVPWYINVANSTQGGKPANGRYDTFTATLTGCTTAPTATVQVVQQGSEVTLFFPDLTATSNTTSCTLTGLPAKYQIANGVNLFMDAVVTNNSVIGEQMMSLDSASGTITLYQGGLAAGFTASGTKGIRRQSRTYRLDL